MLAGGKSLRLGRAKALERINRRSLIERVVNCLSPITQEILVVTSQELLSLIGAARLRARMVVDFYPGKGALGGIYTGLVSADTLYSLIVACDMPFLNHALLRYLIGIASDFDVVVPRIGDLAEPLHAVYSKNCLASIEQLLLLGKLGVSELFSLVKTRYVGEDEIAKFDPEHLSFFNINTSADLKKAKELVKRRENLERFKGIVSASD